MSVVEEAKSGLGEEVVAMPIDEPSDDIPNPSGLDEESLEKSFEAPAVSPSSVKPTHSTSTAPTSKSGVNMLLTCTASEFSHCLLQERFHGNSGSTVEFLQAALAALTSQQQQNGSTSTAVEDEQDITPDMGDPITETTEIAVIAPPRAGKFQITLHEKGLVGSKPNNTSSTTTTRLVIPRESVSDIIFFPKPEDCKKFTKIKVAPADLVLLRLEPAIQFQNKPITQVCLQLPFERKEGAIRPTLVETTRVDDNDDRSDATESWKRVFIQSLGHDDTVVVARVKNPAMSKSSSTSTTQFSSHRDPNSSSTTSGMPFVKCNHGVNDGVLFPLAEGLLFFKPLHYIPRSQLHSIACGRGASSSSRYVDMVLQLHAEKNNDSDGKESDDNGDGDVHPLVVFSNIQRGELGVVNDYIQDILKPAMKQDAASGGEGGNSTASLENSNDGTQDNTVDETSDDEEEEDADYDDDDDEGDEFEDEVEAEIYEDESSDEYESEDDEDTGKAKGTSTKRRGETASTESESEEDPSPKKRRRG